MTYKDFKDYILSAVSDRYAGQAEVSITKVTKNNGLEFYGLLIYEPKYGLSPTIYLDRYYDMLCKGHTKKEILKLIIDTYEKYKYPMGNIAEDFSDFSWARQHIVMRLINREKNSDILSDIPYIPFLDLALCFAVRVRVNNGVFGSALIHNNHAKAWGTDATELFECAKGIAAKLLPPSCERLDSLLSNMLSHDFTAADNICIPVYVLSNTERCYGAASICYHGVVKNLADRLDSDIILIPSSVNEFLAMPDSVDISAETLANTIRSVNNDVVDPTEVLSDHTYFYHRSTDKITY